MNLSDLRSHINRRVVLSFKDGEEINALLLGIDEIDQVVTYEVIEILREGSPPAKGTTVGTTVVARLEELAAFAATA